MNTLIQELAREAENYAAEQNDKFGVSYKQTYNQRFAYLIVKKCASIAFDEYAATSGESSGESAILKHFGVE